MPIWSLTQERVDRLLKQIGDKEMEVDALIKLTPKDIWTEDLDNFIEEWHAQLDEDAARAKKVASMSRRGGTAKGKGKKKRKMGDSDPSDDSESDFGPVKKKAKPNQGGLLDYLKDPSAKKGSALTALKGVTTETEAPKPAAPKPTASKQGGMLSYLTKEPTPAVDDAMDVDKPALVTKRGRPAAPKPPKKPSPPAIESDDDSDIFAAVAKETQKKKPDTAARTARAATKKATTYTVDSDSDSDDLGDKSFGDVSEMVKTIGEGSNERPLFSTTNRPGSASNGRPGSSSGLTSKFPGRLGIQKASPIEEDDIDDTNYEGLMPQASPRKPTPRTINDTMLDSDDDDFGFNVKKAAPGKAAAKPTAKPVAKPVPKPTAKTTKPVPKPKATASALVVKKTALSPAAKAYAAKLGKSKDPVPPKAAKPKKAAVDSDSEMEDADALANDILSDDEDDEPTPKPAARPGRRAAAAKPAKYIVSDDEDEESEQASEASFDEDSD